MDSILCKRNEIRLHVKCLRLRAKCFTLGNGSLKETEKNGSYMSWIQFVNLFCYEKSRENIYYTMRFLFKRVKLSQAIKRTNQY